MEKIRGMKLFLSRIHFPVTTLGFGARVGIWFQGCRIRCPGCVSQDTWAFGRGETTVESVCEFIVPYLPRAEGVTISGGEPFDQPTALFELLRWLRVRFTGDILVFSGYSWEQLGPRLAGMQKDGPPRQARGWAHGLIDLLISDPFDAGAGQTLAMRGSDNQRVHLFTPLAQARYSNLPTARRDATPALDVVFDGDDVWLAGIPAPGDLNRLRQKLAEDGFSAGTSEAPAVLA